MSQSDILEVLKAEPNNWFNCKELATKTAINKSNISTNTKKLRDGNLVLSMKKERSGDLNSRKKPFYYKHKGEMAK
jgi:DNA-binding transcriptional regulator GbsR (MarR family)